MKILACILVILIVRCLVFVSKENVNIENANSFTNQKLIFWGYLASEPDIRLSKTMIEVNHLQGFNTDVGKILIQTSKYPKLKIGQVCKFDGTLIEPENYQDFDYKTYLKNKGIYLILDNPVVNCLSVEKIRKENLLFNTLIDFKDRLINVIDINISEPQASLLSGILFGQKRAFSKDFELYTRITGVSHIVAASGYNVTILVLMVNKLLLFIGKKIRIILSLVVIWCFCIISGLSPSIIRASIMASIALFALLFGKNNSVHISLPLASAIFVLFKPTIIYDVGFQLSIFATMGLIYLLPAIENFLSKIFKVGGFLKEYLLTTLACTISTLPISIITFKTFSIWSVIANTLILPVVESTMLWGALALVFNYISMFVSKFFFLMSYIQLKYFEIVVSGIGSLNLGYFEINDWISKLIGIVILFFVIIFTLYFYPINNEERNYYLKFD